MGLLKVVGLSIGPWVLAGGVILGLTDCGSSGNNGSSGSSSGGNSGSSSGGTTSGATGGGTGASTGGGGTGSTGSSGGGSTGTTVNSGAASGAGSDVTDGGTANLLGPTDATYGGDGSNLAMAADGSSLPTCQPGDTEACSKFQTPTGQTLDLGPYGSQMDLNVGTGFENPINTYDTPNNQTFCEKFVATFKQDPALSAKLLQTSTDAGTLNFALYTVYRPANWPEGKIPVLTWGNGTCAQPEGYGAILRTVASYGFFVIAANSRFVGAATPMLNALNYAAKANGDSSSPYYGHLDMSRVGAWGHSQGGAGTAAAGSDSRVLDLLIFNAVDSAVKPYLAVSGDTDITGFTPASMASKINASTVPAAYLYMHDVPDTGNLNGHLTLMLQPWRLTGPATAWWQMVFNHDPAATQQFVGSGCGLCTAPTDDAGGPMFVYGEHNLEQLAGGTTEPVDGSTTTPTDAATSDH